MIPQKLPRHSISQHWLSIIRFPLSRPSKLLSYEIIFTWNQLWEDGRTWLHSSKKIRTGIMISQAIDIYTIWVILHVSKTLLEVNWMLQVIKRYSTSATCQRCGWARSGPWASYGWRRHSSIQMLWRPWMQKRASNGRNRAWYVPWNV